MTSEHAPWRMLHRAQSYLQIQRSLEPADYWQWEGELATWLRPIAQSKAATA